MITIKFDVRSFLRSLFSVLLLCSLLAQAGAEPLRPADEPSYIVGPIDTQFRVPSEKYVLFNSPGGIVDVAERAAPYFQDKICIVSFAASAAFQILLPACKERYYLPSGALGFHSAHVAFNWQTPMLSPWALEHIARDLSDLNRKMTLNLLMSGFPWSHDAIMASLEHELVLSGAEIMRAEPWILPVENCTHCPEHIKMLR